MTNNFATTPEWETFAGRLRWARKQAGLTQTALSSAIGMSQGAYSQLERSGTASEKTASLAATLGVSPLWLETGEGQPLAGASSPMRYAKIRRVGLRANASVTGAPVEFVDEDEQPIWFQREWLASKGLNASELLAVSVRGASMEPTLYDGDLVVFDTSRTEPRDGRVFVLNYEGELVVKRMARDGGLWWVDSDNQDKARFPRKACNGCTTILGEVIYRQSSRI